MEDPSLDEAQQLRDYSDEQTKVLDTMEAEGRRLFPPSSTVFYANVHTLQSAVQQWANAKGAHTSYQGHGFWCKRAEQPRSFKIATDKARLKNKIPVEQQRERTSMRCGCAFVIKFADATPKTIRRGAAPQGSVRITEGSNYRHTNGCFPSQYQLIVDQKSSGNYQDKVKHQISKCSRTVPILMLKMNPGRSDKESGVSHKKRAQEASTPNEAQMYKKNPGRSVREAGASERKRAQKASTPSEVERSKKAKIPQYIYILLYTEGGPYREEFEPEIIGVYSCKTLAIQNAKVAFEDKSNGFYINGEFTEPMVLDETDDSTESIGDEGDVLFQKDREGEWNKISLKKKELDESIY